MFSKAVLSLCFVLGCFVFIPGKLRSSKGTKLKRRQSVSSTKSALMVYSLEVNEDAIPGGICARVVSGKN